MTDQPLIPPPVVGLLGGIGSGKSTVAGILADLGARVLNADEMVHDLLEEADIVAALVGLLGPDILADTGRIDRTRLAAAIFGTGRDAQRRAVEALIHPPVGRRLAEAVDSLRRASQPPAAIILDVPLLLESPLAGLCDQLIFVETSAIRRQELVSRHRGWTAEELNRREAAQAGIADKRAKADHIVRNEGSLEDLKRQVEQVFAILHVLPPQSQNGRPPPAP